MSEQALCWINGSRFSPESARISVFDHGLLYGDGIFEGIRFYNGKPFRLQQHLERLFDSAKAIAIDPPYSISVLEQAVASLVNGSDRASGYIRLLLTRGEGSLGLNPTLCLQPNMLIIVDQLNLTESRILARGARTIIAATRRLPADGLDPRIKSLNYLNNVMARIEANRAGVDEAILLNGFGRVAEGTVDNIFLVRQGRLITPPVSEGALEGITRNLIMELGAANGLEVREQSITAYDLYTADECFLCGTGAELIPVAEVDGRLLKQSPGPCYQKLLHLFRRQIDLECPRQVTAAG